MQLGLRGTRAGMGAASGGAGCGVGRPSQLAAPRRKPGPARSPVAMFRSSNGQGLHDDAVERTAGASRGAGRHARADRPARLRRGRADRAARRERDGAFPRAPRLQGRREVPGLSRHQRDGRAARRRAERLHVARSRRLPHHRARRDGARGDRPLDGLRRAPADRRGRARPRARGRDSGDRARPRPAGIARGDADRPRCVRRASARAAGARARGALGDVHARRDRRVSRAALGGRARWRLPGRQPRCGSF